CSRQVESLTRHYKDIVELGARLILVTPKPLETTRRVAAFFEVEFEFWLDDQLDAARQMGLVMRAGVPDDHRREYGTDTVWPTALVVDAAGIIRFARLSRFIVDRPNPKALLKELKKL
ncbi:MAG: redoxin domain-containing protein, partial [Woeseiaceae bacterium]